MTKRLTIALVALVALVLVAVLPASATYYPVNNTINAGSTVFIGEQGLDLTPAMTTFGNPTTIGWWASAASLTSTSPTTSVPLTSTGAFYVSSSSFVGYTGNWYALDANGYANNTAGSFFNVKDPSVVVKAWDFSTGIDATGGSVIQGDYLGFRIDTNLNEVLNPTYRTNSSTTVNGALTQGNIDIKVKSDSGNTYNALYYGASGSTYTGSIGITNQKVNLSSWYFGTTDHQYPTTTNVAAINWSTGVLDASGQQAYPTGTYTVTVESRVNGMKDNYKNSGADYTGKTVSQAGTVTIVSNTVKIEANKDSVVRSKPFSVTVTGKPYATYHVWIKGTTTMDGTYDNQPPMIAQNQAGVTMDDSTTAYDLFYTQGIVDPSGSGYAGAYVFQNHGSIVNLFQNVANGTQTVNSIKMGNHTYLYANVTLNDQGTRTVQWVTTNWTKAQKYTIRVEQNFSGQYKSDEVDVKVEKGAVTIVAAGDQSYYLGEEIKFSGTNTESSNTYLFITGPNLPDVGGSMNSLDPRNNKVDTTDSSTYVIAAVEGDNTWSYKWGTSNVALDAGTYTIYATSQLATTESDTLANVAYGTVSIVIKKPFVSATVSQSTVAQGDNVYITGTAEGQPSVGVDIWILGKNYARVYSESVNSDASFSYEIQKATTKDMYTGQYFVVVQHPMQNDRFDVYADGDPATSTSIVKTVDQDTGLAADATVDFKLSGSGSLQGSDAAEALIEAINDANVDDTYTKLQFLVEVPVINIDTIGDRHVGDKFTITATTNLAIDDEVLFEVYSSSFQPTQKSQSGEFSGATGTVKVTKGDSGLNKLSFDVDASTFKPDEYLVTATAVLQDATGTALFNVLEASTTIATPSVTATAVTTAPVTAVTTVPVTTATPTKTPTQPGFGALVALIGLGAVALLVVRKH